MQRCACGCVCSGGEGASELRFTAHHRTPQQAGGHTQLTPADERHMRPMTAGARTHLEQGAAHKLRGQLRGGGPAGRQPSRTTHIYTQRGATAVTCHPQASAGRPLKSAGKRPIGRALGCTYATGTAGSGISRAGDRVRPQKAAAPQKQLQIHPHDTHPSARATTVRVRLTTDRGRELLIGALAGARRERAGAPSTGF
jgi:hypothetical protein